MPPASRSIGAPGSSYYTLPPLGRPAEAPRGASQLASAQPRTGRCCPGVGAAGTPGSRAPAAFAMSSPSTASSPARRQFGVAHGASHGSSGYGSSGYGASSCRAASPSIYAGAGAPLASPHARARAGSGVTPEPGVSLSRTSHSRPAAQRSEPRPELLRPTESSRGRPAAQAPELRPELPRSTEPSGKGGTCDKCDGGHPTDGCPFFQKARENHPDARNSPGRKALGDDPGRAEVLSGASVVRQPADGSCLFHSLCHGLCDGTTAPALRRQIGSFIEANPELLISDSPLREWVLWDSDSSVPVYCHKITAGGAWGGGIEMAVVARLCRVCVHVYESRGGGFKRISRFPSPAGDGKVIRVLYRGRAHYDALEA